jgi:acyl carrier protein
LNPVARWQLNQSVDRSIFKDVMHLRSKAKSDRLKQRIMKCLSLWVAANTGEDLDRIEGGESFAELGIDSLKAVQMAQEIELWLKVSVSPVVAWSYPTCDALAAHLAKLYVDDVEKDVDVSAEAQDDLIGLLDDIEAMDEQVVDQICSSRRQIN